MIIIGALSGTSVDGIDVAVVRVKLLKRDLCSNSESIEEQFHGLSRSLQSFARTYALELQQLAFETVSWSEGTRDLILRLCQAPSICTVRDVCVANFQLGAEFADAIQTVLRKNNIPHESVDVIGSHGILLRPLN